MQTIKYDPAAWLDFGASKSAPCPKDAHVRLSQPGSVSVDLGSGFRVVGYGTEFKLSLPLSGKVKCDVPFSVYVGTEVEVQQLGVPLTNMDKRPGESSVERMVRQVLREKEVRQALERKARLEQDRKTHEQRFAKGLQDDNPMPEPEPEPDSAEPEPTPPTSGEAEPAPSI